jgi:uncharacterized protein YkwD
LSLHAARRALARTVVGALLTSTIGGLAALAVPTSAFAESTATMESQFVAKINSARESNGLRPYSVASDLTSVARQHSADMAAKQSLYHNPDLTTQVQNWQAVGENVGEGPTVDDIHQAFMNSPEHRDNILDHDFTQVGVGVSVDGHGTIWVTEDFRQPMHSSTATRTSAPAHPASAAPAPSAVAQPAGSVQSASSQPAPTWHPSTRLSPRARLLARLSRLRAAHPAVRPVDPVAGSFDFVSSLSQLTS